MNSVLIPAENAGPVASASDGTAATRKALPKVGVGVLRWAGSRSR